MKRRLPYARCIVSMAVAAARREFQQRGVELLTRGDQTFVVRTIAGEGLPIAANARSWRFNDGRANEPRAELQRDAEFARRLNAVQS